MAALRGLRLVPHVWGTAVQIAASLQFVAALLPDPPRRDPVAPIFEFDRTHNPFRQAIVNQPVEHENGTIRIPDGPGLGIEINRALFEDGAGDARWDRVAAIREAVGQAIDEVRPLLRDAL